MSKYILFLFFFSSLILSRELYTQNDISNNVLQDCIENYYGENDLLINGNIYIPTNPKISGHQFYLNNEYLRGKVFIKGQTFDNLLLKYDIVHDDIILLHKNKTGSRIEIILSNKLIDSFYLSAKNSNFYYEHFINTNLIRNNDFSNKYLKSINIGKIKFLIGYKKKYFATYTDVNPSGLFSKSTKTIYMLKDKTLYKIKNKKNLISFFKEHKTEIKHFFKKNKIKFKKINDSQLLQLSKYINNLYK